MIVNFLSEGLLEEASHQTEIHPAHISLDRVAVIVLSGGEGTRLRPLTDYRCKPAIKFGGRYSLIDVPISHSLTSGLNKIYVIGQYMAYTLQNHLFKTYLYHGISQNQIQLLVPEERQGKKVWYKGTADAIRQNIDYFSEVSADYFLILSGDQLYNINFQQMINYAIDVDAGMLIAAQPVNVKDAKRMGLLKIEHGSSRITDFYEKPQDEKILGRFHVDDFTLQRLGYTGHDSKHYLGSMGIYLFKRQVMFDLLKRDPREDFGKHLIKTEMENRDVHAFLYDGYWEDIGTVESFFHANLALTRHGDNRKFGLQCYDSDEQIITQRYNLPGAKVINCHIDSAVLCEGSVVEAKEVKNSIVGVRTVIGEGSVIRNAVVMGNEYYERPPLSTGEAARRPGIGASCHIEKAILDENVTIGNHVKLLNKNGYIDYNSPDGLVVVRDGITIVPRGTYIPDHYTF